MRRGQCAQLGTQVPRGLKGGGCFAVKMTTLMDLRARFNLRASFVIFEIALAVRSDGHSVANNLWHHMGQFAIYHTYDSAGAYR